MGEFLNHRVFSRHDPREIEVDLRNADAPGPRVSREVNHIRRVEERLGRHAAAQDAQPADLFAAFDDGRFQTGAGRRARRRVTAAAAAEDGDLEIEFAHAKEDGSAAKKSKFQI